MFTYANAFQQGFTHYLTIKGEQFTYNYIYQ